ncbi:MAG: hypothetical protein D6739_05990 [Nitrospirae bacterium]|nr:MAG: hypothetical protein D6739_05990 [Nitrospirota bacterium]
MGHTKLIATLAALATAAALLPPPAAAGPIRARQRHQQVRILQGIHQGDLTRGEVRRLEREQRQIERARRRAWADGTLTPRERARLHLRQDRASAHIYKARHD